MGATGRGTRQTCVCSQHGTGLVSTRDLWHPNLDAASQMKRPIAKQMPAPSRGSREGSCKTNPLGDLCSQAGSFFAACGISSEEKLPNHVPPHDDCQDGSCPKALSGPPVALAPYPKWLRSAPRAAFSGGSQPRPPRFTRHVRPDRAALGGFVCWPASIFSSETIDSGVCNNM
jgi:hypothetical protein